MRQPDPRLVDVEQRELFLARRRDPLAEPTSEDDPELDVPEDGPRWAEPVAFQEDVVLEAAEVSEEATEEGAAVWVEFRPQGDADAAVLVFATSGGVQLSVVVDPNLGLARIEPGSALEEP